MDKKELRDHVESVVTVTGYYQSNLADLYWNDFPRHSRGSGVSNCVIFWDNGRIGASFKGNLQECLDKLMAMVEEEVPENQTELHHTIKELEDAAT